MLVSSTSPQVRLEDGSKFASSQAKISPIRVEAKKAVVQAVNITCFANGSQLDCAILCPMVLSMGNVTTRLVDEMGFMLARCADPLSIRLISGSFARWSWGMPFRLCANFRATRYALMEEGWRCLALWHHAAKALHVSLERGHWKDVQWAASKQAKAFKPDWYLPQVDLAMDACTKFAKASSVSPVAGDWGRVNGAVLFSSAWSGKRACGAYFARRFL